MAFFCKIQQCLVKPNVYNGNANSTKECVNFNAKNQNICNQCVQWVREAIVTKAK